MTDITQKSDWGDGQTASELLGWLLPKIKDWRQYRDDNYKELWDEYYRLWRGIWDPKDKVRDSERSRLISPSLQQAVEGGVAEMQEALFGRDVWFDLIDNKGDTNPKDMEEYRTLLKEDLDKEKAPKAINESILNGALYGSGIGEIITEEKDDLYPDEQQIAGTQIKARGVSKRTYICVRLNPVSPYNFSSDPGVADVEEALGCEITELVPEHLIRSGIKAGSYWDVDYGSYTQDSKSFNLPGERQRIPSTDKVKLTRYYGKVPSRYLARAKREEMADEAADTSTETTDEEELDDLVEAIVIIANDQAVLKAARNPYMMQDRPVVAYQHDTVPGRFWGRGICEKGYNPQKALDTELRARADNLALTTHPMMGVDASRLPRGIKPKVQPGQTIFTTGDPNTVLRPLNFGNLNPVSFRESAELERMVTMGTGTMDTAAPLGVNPRNATLGGMSMMQAASIKRQKRTLQNFNDSFLAPFIQKALWRKMQFEPERYPVKDFKFQATSSLGIMARELEIQNMVTLLGYVADTPAAPLILKGIVSHSSFPEREDIIAGLDQMMQQQQQQGPDPEQQTREGQLKVQEQANQIQAQKNQTDAQGSAEDRKLKIIEIGLKGRELALREKELVANSALKEMQIHTDSQHKSADLLVRAHSEAQGGERDMAKAHLAADSKDKAASAKTPAKQNVVVEFPTQKKTVTITTPSGKVYKGEISPSGAK